MFERIYNKPLNCLVIPHTLFIEWELGSISIANRSTVSCILAVVHRMLPFYSHWNFTVVQPVDRFLLWSLDELLHPTGRVSHLIWFTTD